MSFRDMNTLIPEFHDRIELMLEELRAESIIMVPYCTQRTPFEQGKLWRQSRSGSAVRAKIKTLKRIGAPFLAHCIESVGPQSGPKVTGAIPGLSWHQWGEAVDCYWHDKADMDNDGKTEVDWGGPGYRLYGDAAARQGLTSGGRDWGWDWPHVQLRRQGSPRTNRFMSWKEIDAAMQRRYS